MADHERPDLGDRARPPRMAARRLRAVPRPGEHIVRLCARPSLVVVEGRLALRRSFDDGADGRTSEGE